MRYLKRFNEEIIGNYDKDNMLEMYTDIKECLREYIDEYDMEERSGVSDFDFEQEFIQGNGIYYCINVDDYVGDGWDDDIDEGQYGYTINLFYKGSTTEWSSKFDKLRTSILGFIRRLKGIGYTTKIINESYSGLKIFVYEKFVAEIFSVPFKNPEDSEEIREVLDIFQEVIDEWLLKRSPIKHSDITGANYSLLDHVDNYDIYEVHNPDKKGKYNQFAYQHIIFLTVFLDADKYEENAQKMLTKMFSDLDVFQDRLNAAGYQSQYVESENIRYGQFKIKIVQ